MKLRTIISVVLAAAVWTVAIAPARAEDEDSAMLLTAQSFNGVTYLAGGIGLDEREAMQAVRHEYTLWLAFASKGGSAYIADTEVIIQDAKGHMVLETVADGPWLMAKLPVGQYRVTARSARGKEVTQRVVVNGKSAQRHVMHVYEGSRS